MKLSEEKLSQIVGGAVTVSLLNSLSRIASTIYDIGYALGSTVRKLFGSNTC